MAAGGGLREDEKKADRERETSAGARAVGRVAYGSARSGGDSGNLGPGGCAEEGYRTTKWETKFRGRGRGRAESRSVRGMKRATDESCESAT